MDGFYLQPASILALSQMILCAALSGYLFSIKDKKQSTWYLALTIASFTILWFVPFQEFGFIHFSSLHLRALDDLMSPIILFFLLRFAYAFLNNPYLKETKIISIIAGAIICINTIYQIYRMIVPHNHPDSLEMSHEIFNASLAILTIIVFFRKKIFYTNQASTKRGQNLFKKIFIAEEKNEKALRAFGLLTIAILIIPSFSTIETAGFASPILFYTKLLLAVLILITLTVIYINHSGIPTTILAKILGISLVTILSVLGILSMAIFPDESFMRESHHLLPLKQTLRFSSNADHTYRLQKIPYSFDTDFGENLNFKVESDLKVAFEFDFPFFKNNWREMYIDANGLVSFGAPYLTTMFSDFIPDKLPKIAVYYRAIIPEKSPDGDVYYKHDLEKATVTWFNVAERYSENPDNRNTFQLILHQNGDIDFIYERLEAQLFYGMRGLHPGGKNQFVERVNFTGLLENIGNLAKNSVSQTTPDAIWLDNWYLSYRSLIHEKMQPLAFLLLGATAFILLIFPLFFRDSLLKPLAALLKGVQQVDEGNRKIEVPVRVNDEIGYLTENFNRMTGSLTKAEAELKAYSENLEEKVAERTAELQDSLKKLTEAQDQLIHAQKMASLGRLTSGVAHEIKNPLNFVNNFASLSAEMVDELAEELDAFKQKIKNENTEILDEILSDLRQNAEKINEHGKRADNIVRSMLQHSRSQPGQPELTNLNSLLEEYIALAYHGMRAEFSDYTVNIEKEFNDELEAVLVMPQEIGRVFINLLNNAFYAVREKVTENNKQYSPSVFIFTQFVDKWAEIRIKDNGNGIPEDIKDKIFEPFFTTKPTGTGTGLGLSLSYDIITTGHNGLLTFNSEAGSFTEFIIRLPKS